MAAGRRNGAVTGVITAILLAATLAGCAGSEADAIAGADLGGAELVDATLAETKSPVQLLRNEAATRLPDIIVKDVVDSIDESVGCADAADDPEGLARSWVSHATILVVNSQAARIHTVADDMVATFVEQGWEVTTDGDADVTVTELAREGSYAGIEIEAQSKSDEHPPAINISVTGPCVLTDGPDSDEVLQLEGRDQAE